MVIIAIYTALLIATVILLSITSYNPEKIMTIAVLWPLVAIWLIGFWIKENL